MAQPTKNKARLRVAVITLLVLMGGLTAASPLNHLLGGSLPLIHPAYAALGPNNNLGIDCALGASADAPNPFPTLISTKDSDGVIDTGGCQWTGDVDGDTHTPFPTFDPLVSDSPELLSPQIGGGFIADVIFTNMNVTINAFDITVNYDPHILDFVAIDQSGLTFGGNVGCPSTNPQCTLQLASSADRVNGVIRLAQTILQIKVGPNGDTGNINQVTLFRLRFDVIGAGYTSIHFGTNLIVAVLTGTQTAPDPHYTTDGSFSTQDIFNFVDSQPLAPSNAWFNASWSFSPNPEVPSSPLTFTATASCSYCKGPLTYNWDFSSVDSSTYIAKIDKTGSAVTITAPPPLVNRVTLTVTNATGTVYVSATRLLPFTAQGPLNSLAVGVVGSIGGSWLGGVPPYSGNYILCPAQSKTDYSVCSNPAPVFPLGTPQNKTVAISYKYAGLYTSKLNVTDSSPFSVGGPFTATGIFLVNVTGTPSAYTVGLSSNQTVAFSGHAVQFSATVGYNTNYPAILRSTSFKYVFFFGDGTSQIITSGASASVPHTYLSSGQFHIVVQVQERTITKFSSSKIQENGYSTIAVDVPITADFSTNPSALQSGQAVTFTATASGGSSTFTYSWNFGDGTTGTGSTATHTYSNAGTYNVNLTITDSYGGTTIVSRSVTVTPPSTNQPAAPFPIVYVAAGGIGAAALLAALMLLIRRRRKDIPSPV